MYWNSFSWNKSVGQEHSEGVVQLLVYNKRDLLLDN